MFAYVIGFTELFLKEISVFLSFKFTQASSHPASVKVYLTPQWKILPANSCVGVPRSDTPPKDVKQVVWTLVTPACLMSRWLLQVELHHSCAVGEQGASCGRSIEPFALGSPSPRHAAKEGKSCYSSEPLGPSTHFLPVREFLPLFSCFCRETPSLYFLSATHTTSL